MCRKKPGPRCYQHSRRALAASQRRLNTAIRRVEDARRLGRPQRIAAAKDDMQQAALKHVWAQRDFDGTRTQLDALRAALQEPNLNPTTARTIQARIDAATTLREARREHTKLMPDLPGHANSEAQAEFVRLGAVREAMARWDTSRALGESGTDPQSLAYRETLEGDAFAAEVSLQAALVGHADRDQLDAEELRALHAGPGSPLASQIVYLSHARAVIADGHYPDEISDLVDARTAQVREQILDSLPAPRRAALAAAPRRVAGRRGNAVNWEQIARGLAGGRTSTAARGGMLTEQIQVGKRLQGDVVGDELRV